MKIRGSGILLHISSLPSRYGIGDLGPSAYRFVDFLATSGQKYWQILPLNPTELAYENNPYHSTSAFAQNPLFISPDLMAEDGLIDVSDIHDIETFPDQYVDFARVISFKERIFSHAYDRFVLESDRRDFEKFCEENSWWLDGYSLYSAIQADLHSGAWNRWPEDLRLRKPDVIMRETERLHDCIEKIQFLQFVFMQQWLKLHKYCRDHDICIIGDIPIYVHYDSADVWLHPEYFKLDHDLRPTVVAGVPPDYFSTTGQLWHNPIYRWDALQESGFVWWVQRMQRNLALVDYVRIDHFRGLISCWEVPSGSNTAMDGKWVAVPGEELLSTFERKFPCLPVIAEDLGIITPDVREVMQRFEIPGMKILLFAFEEGFEKNPYIPHNVVRNCILYTGTHDNNPVRGWIDEEATDQHRHRLRQYFGHEISAEELNWVFIRLAMSTVANTVITPLQDVLGLGSAYRMNRPGTYEGNWKWRFSEDMLTLEITEKLRSITTIFARD